MDRIKEIDKALLPYHLRKHPEHMLKPSFLLNVKTDEIIKNKVIHLGDYGEIIVAEVTELGYNIQHYYDTKDFPYRIYVPEDTKIYIFRGMENQINGRVSILPV